MVFDGQEQELRLSDSLLGLEEMALGSSLMPTFTALPTLGSPCISLPPSPPPKASQALFPAALRIGEAAFQGWALSAVPYPNEAQTLGSGVLSVCPTHMPKATGLPQGGQQGSTSQADPTSGSLPQVPAATLTVPPGVRSGRARSLHSTGKAKLVSNEVAAQKEAALVFVWHQSFKLRTLAAYPVSKAEQPASRSGGCAGPRSGRSC